MKQALEKLSAEQIRFIYNECNITEEELLVMSEDELYDRVYDVMCDIELEELPDSDSEKESERCEMASDIVTELGNALAEEQGTYGESDDE